MSRQELIRWIRKNDEIYSDINLSIFTDEELLACKKKINSYKKIKSKKEMITAERKQGQFA